MHTVMLAGEAAESAAAAGPVVTMPTAMSTDRIRTLDSSADGQKNKPRRGGCASALVGTAGANRGLGGVCLAPAILVVVSVGAEAADGIDLLAQLQVAQNGAFAGWIDFGLAASGNLFDLYVPRFGSG